jgi:hypothetical protein
MAEEEATATLRRFAGAVPVAVLLSLSAGTLVGQQAAAAPSAADASTPSEDHEARERREREERKERDRLAPELDRMLRSGKLGAFWIDVTWPTAPNQLTSVRLYGNGVGTWNRGVQFRLSPAEVRGIAEEVREMRFGGFPLEVREEEKSEKKREERDETELYGRIVAGAGDVTHIVKMMGDEAEPELETLAKKVIGLAEKPAARGEKIGGLDDGLRRVADGTLAPETLEVLARRKVDKPKPGAADENWILRINGRRAVDRDMTRQPAVERELKLSDHELKALVAVLREAKAGSLPQSLWAPRYTTLRVQVLNQMRNVQARQFVGMTPETHGAPQKAFEKVFAWCEKTHARALAQGRVLPRNVQERDRESEEERERERD